MEEEDGRSGFGNRSASLWCTEFKKGFQKHIFYWFSDQKRGQYLKKMRAAFLLRIKSSPKCLSGAHPMRKQGRAWHFLYNGIVHWFSGHDKEPKTTYMYSNQNTSIEEKGNHSDRTYILNPEDLLYRRGGRWYGGGAFCPLMANILIYGPSLTGHHKEAAKKLRKISNCSLSRKWILWRW